MPNKDSLTEVDIPSIPTEKMESFIDFLAELLADEFQKEMTKEMKTTKTEI